MLTEHDRPAAGLSSRNRQEFGYTRGVLHGQQLCSLHGDARVHGIVLSRCRKVHGAPLQINNALSDTGGQLGILVGMSVFSLCEIAVMLIKVTLTVFTGRLL